MKALGLAAMVAAVVLVACSDEKAPPTAPQAAVVAQTATRVAGSANSTVCKSYVKELTALNSTASGSDLVETKSALEGMIADACN